jgi:glucosamine--fructose-6-phosphate aminotransferase (isomerizing)
MCGIYGFFTEANYSGTKKSELVKTLISQVEKRGSDGIGLLHVSNSVLSTHKSFLKPSEFVKTDEFKRILEDIESSTETIFIVQGRLATSGSVSLENQHPLNLDESYFFHNGIFLDDKEESGKFGRSDSWVLFDRFMDKSLSPDSILNMESENSYALLDARNRKLQIGSNTGSMFLADNDKSGISIFGSEPVSQLVGVKVDEQLRGTKDFKIPGAKGLSNFTDFEMGNNSFRKNEKYCKNCGLTKLAFTHFSNDKDICNRCSYSGTEVNVTTSESKENLYRLLENSKVVVGFSGGRDSSYALLQLSKIPGIEIIAVSYDWGGITDLGRRNQSRVCGKLKIEHVWISADIEKKRRNVQKNLLAWIQKPSLATIPLMLAGDKAMWRYPLQIAKKRQAKYVVYCTNPLERTDFKVALAGVKSKSNSTRPQVVAKIERIQLMAMYALELLRNPRLLNSSLIDSLLGFKYYFFDSAKNIQYFDYEEWNEAKVNAALKSEFGWEFSKTKKSSWRIGDITTPFYNMAYFSSLGFTEFDTLRANQVRAGHLKISEALEYLVEDNSPDYQGIRDYSECMGVPQLSLMRGIERLTRRRSMNKKNGR